MKINIIAKEIQPQDKVNGREVIAVDTANGDSRTALIHLDNGKVLPLSTESQIVVERKVQQIDQC